MKHESPIGREVRVDSRPERRADLTPPSASPTKAQSLLLWPPPPTALVPWRINGRLVPWPLRPGYCSRVSVVVMAASNIFTIIPSQSLPWEMPPRTLAFPGFCSLPLGRAVSPLSSVRGNFRWAGGQRVLREMSQLGGRQSVCWGRLERSSLGTEPAPARGGRWAPRGAPAPGLSLRGLGGSFHPSLDR